MGRFRFVAFLIATGLIAASLIAGALQGSVARAQEYPTRPIRIIVATSPGGVSDIFLRALSDPMHQRLGQLHSLALAGRQVLALLSDEGAIATGQSEDGFVDVRVAGGLDDLEIACVGPSKRDVVADRSLEKD